MYSQKIISSRLESFAEREGWMPVRHTVGETDEFKKYINSIIKIESNSRNSSIELAKSITDRRAKEIKRWIENEQVLCALDSDYFETRYAYVCDEEGQIIKFESRLSQQIYTSVLADLDEKQFPIQLLILKGRQLGITTQTALKFIHRMMFVPHTQAIMASVKASASELIERILNTAYNNSPWWLVPQRMPKGAFANGSILSIQSGMQATGLAQGWTPTCLAPSTRIRIGNGFTAEIRNVTEGDVVITDSGDSTRVIAVRKMNRENSSTRIIKLWGNFEKLECTTDHKIKTPCGWVEAAELSVGDYVSHPIRKIRNEIGGAMMQKLPRGKVDADKLQNVYVPYSESFGYLCGFYLAEGNIHESAIGHKTKKPYISQFIFSVHQKEVEHRTKKLKEIFGEEYKFRTTYPTDNGAKIDVNCAWMARWMAEHFGRKEKKTVPDWAWSAGENFCRGIVNGYLDGDGSYEVETNTIRAKSICNTIILQMRDLIASLGYGWSSIYFAQQKWRHPKKVTPTWELGLIGPTGYAYRKEFNLPTQDMKNGSARHWKWGDGEIEVMIEGVEDSISESVYDIEVESKDHSFTTVQCAVHNCAHLSEVADLPSPKKTIEEGLFRAMHPSDKLFMVLEGTGGGSTGWLADTWRSAKSGDHRLKGIFIPWACCPEIYPKDGFIRERPVPGNFMAERSDACRKHVARAESYIRNTPYLARVMGKEYRMPVEQQWYWEFNYRAACQNHTQKTWLNQMPCDDFESLTGKHDSVFDPEVIDEVENHIYEVITDYSTGAVAKERKKPVQAYAITGHDVDEVFYPDEGAIDYEKPVIRVSWNSHRGQSYYWDMIPLLPLSEENEQNTMDRLLVYEDPKSGCYYSCGIDTADGLGKEDEDRTVISGAKNRYGDEYDEQVFELTSNKINSAQIVAFAACVGAWYGPMCPDSRGLKYCVEQIRGPGDTCQHQLKMMGFNNHHKPRRYDGKNIKEKPGNKEGWYSNSWSVPMLMTRFIEAVNGGWYQPHSKWLVEELKTLERHESAGKSKMEHRSGQHDDRVRAAAQSYFTKHDDDVLAERSQKRYSGIAAHQRQKKKQQKNGGRIGLISVGEGWN